MFGPKAATKAVAVSTTPFRGCRLAKTKNVNASETETLNRAFFIPIETLTVNQQRLIRNPQLIEAILHNPRRTPEAERRAWATVNAQDGGGKTLPGGEIAHPKGDMAKFGDGSHVALPVLANDPLRTAIFLMSQ
ncbi:MAG: hypothetical protein RLZZ563_1817 [Pseudomonadota bacterium]